MSARHRLATEPLATLASLATVATLAVCSAAGAQAPMPPQKLAVYYSWPSSINGTYSVPAAAAAFAAYDLVVLGDGLQDPAHPDHANTTAIVAAAPSVRFFGYVSIGQTTVGLTLAQLQARIHAWATTGVRGVLLDEAGFDYGVTRTRCNAVIDLVHAAGLEALANAWQPDDVFSPSPVPLNAVGGGNPTGLATHLGPTDHYLLESFFVANGAYQDPVFGRARADAAVQWRALLGTHVVAVTTTLAGQPFDQAQCDCAFWWAQLYGLDGFGWGEPDYAALTASMPYRARPQPGNLGTAWCSAVIHAPNLARDQRLTDAGTLRIDSAAHTGGFLPAAITGPTTAAIGQTTWWTFAAPASPSAQYLAVLTEATAPGIPLADGRVLPVFPGVLFGITAGANPFTLGFSGALSSAGTAPLGLVVPPAPWLAGLSFFLAAAVIDTADPALIAVYPEPRAIAVW